MEVQCRVRVGVNCESTRQTTLLTTGAIDARPQSINTCMNWPSFRFHVASSAFADERDCKQQITPSFRPNEKDVSCAPCCAIFTHIAHHTALHTGSNILVGFYHTSTAESKYRFYYYHRRGSSPPPS